MNIAKFLRTAFFNRKPLVAASGSTYLERVMINNAEKKKQLQQQQAHDASYYKHFFIVMSNFIEKVIGISMCFFKLILFRAARYFAVKAPGEYDFQADLFCGSFSSTIFQNPLPTCLLKLQLESISNTFLIWNLPIYLLC